MKTLPKSPYDLPDNSLGLYIHYPWCLQKCHYCDFYSIEKNEESKEEQKLYRENIIKELEKRLKDPNLAFSNKQKISSIYWGGGTPSLMPIEDLAFLLEKLQTYFELSKNCEITLEANPENINHNYLESLYQLGINRLSVGIQTFQARLLEKMNRFYSLEAYENILDHLSNGPFQNYSLDLMYGFPQQKEEDFFRDLENVLKNKPPHLSLYSLTVEPNTVYGSRVKNKVMPPPNTRLQESIWQKLRAFFKKENYINYEVSNFAQNTFCSKHNLAYWLYLPYLGLGPGASGFDGKLRYSNSRSLQNWFTEQGSQEYTKHQPNLEFPLVFLRLAEKWPLSLAKKIIKKQLGKTEEGWESFLKCLEDWVSQGYARFDEAEDKEVFFLWKASGLNFLNDRIWEISQKVK